MIHFRLPLSLLALISAGACVRAGHLSAGCTLAPSEAAWSSSAVTGRVEGAVVDRAEQTPIANLELRLEVGACA